MSKLVCPYCHYENIVLTCGFCLHCGRDLTGVSATAESETNAAPSAEPQTADLESRLRAACRLLGAPLESSRNGWTAQLSTKNDRQQRIHMMETIGDNHDSLVSFLSICGPAEPKNAMSLLECNSRLKTCAFAIRKINGNSMFVVTANYPVDVLTAREMARTINEIVAYADRVEAQIGTGTDRY